MKQQEQEIVHARHPRHATNPTPLETIFESPNKMGLQRGPEKTAIIRYCLFFCLLIVTTTLLQCFVDPSFFPSSTQIFQDAKQKSVRFNEFYHTPPSSADLEEVFAFESPDWSTVPHPARLGSCQGNITTKLTYVHMTRSAGSSLRPFLKAWARHCGRSLVLLGQCVDVGMEETNVWRNVEASPAASKDCWLQYAVHANGTVVNESPVPELRGRVNHDFLHKMDAIGGHVSLETGSIFGSNVNLVMMREPLRKYVGERIVVTKAYDLSDSEIAKRVYQKAREELEQGKYRDSYSSYLITPQQRQWADTENLQWTLAQRSSLSRKNILQLPVVMGIMDRMNESIELFARTLGEPGELDELVHFMNNPDIGSKMHELRKSSARTNRIAQLLEADTEMLETMNRYLKYEHEIYEVANQLHLKQYEWAVKLNRFRTK